MAFKFVVFAALVAVTRAGFLPAYSSPLTYAAPAVAKVAYSPATAVSYSSVSSPLVAKVAAPVAYASPAVSYSAPALSYGSPTLSYGAPALKTVSYAPALSYAAPTLKVAAPALSYAAPALSYASPALSYGSPGLKVAAPSVSYGPALSYAAPAYKVAAPVAYAAPIAKTIVAEPSAPAQYDFGYAVSDPHTGDSKSQQESRRGDAVQGSYSLIEADGSKRTVEYTADAHSGFNAVVHNEPAAVHVKAVAPVAHGYAAPLAHGYAAPLSQGYAAPLSQGYAAPAYYH